MLFCIVKDPTTSADELNYDLQTITEWAHQWKLEFNPDPNKQTELLFIQIKYTIFHPPLPSPPLPSSIIYHVPCVEYYESLYRECPFIC